MRNRTSDLRIPRSDALPLSHRDMFFKLITSVICSKKQNSSCELSQPCLWNELKTREEALFRYSVFLDFFPQVSTHLSQICPGCDTHNRVRLYETLHHVILNQINWIEPFNPLNPKRDQHLFSPNNNTAESFIKIMRKKGNDHQLKKFWLLNKFSLSVPNEMHRGELGEYKYWC